MAETMSARDRFRATMAYAPGSRPPLFEEGLRDEVIERWQDEGLDGPERLQALVRYDRRERITLDTGLRPPLEGALPCDLDTS
ncbi:MAG: hypothetical protein FJX72_16765, partial [Armatimonadetes bacterium]|nr:hypothetical protein [Armatimonadota bacterium]